MVCPVSDDGDNVPDKGVSVCGVEVVKFVEFTVFMQVFNKKSDCGVEESVVPGYASNSLDVRAEDISRDAND
jgi:hypothetical protein